MTQPPDTDAAWCHTFVATLRQESKAGIWYDEHNLGYGRLMDEIEREMRARPIFLVVLSSAAVASQWVRREVHGAIELADRDAERIILPVAASACEVPLFWREITKQLTCIHERVAYRPSADPLQMDTPIEEMTYQC